MKINLKLINIILFKHVLLIVQNINIKIKLFIIISDFIN